MPPDKAADRTRPDDQALRDWLTNRWMAALEAAGARVEEAERIGDSGIRESMIGRGLHPSES